MSQVIPASPKEIEVERLRHRVLDLLGIHAAAVADLLDSSPSQVALRSCPKEEQNHKFPASPVPEHSSE